MITLVLGGARSGKSIYAQQLAEHHELPITYIATATRIDNEMIERIAHHEKNRPSEWRLLECPLELAKTLKEEAGNQQTILIDCLTLWLNNQLFDAPQQSFAELFQELSASIVGANANIIMVANEVGLGIIPLGEVSRVFVDEAGRLNQAMAKIADQVYFIAAGLPLTLKNNRANRL